MIRARDGKREFVQLTSPEVPKIVSPAPPTECLAEMLSLEQGMIGSDKLQPVIVSGGTPFLLVPIRERKMIGEIRLRLDRYDSLRVDLSSRKGVRI